jgi:hypothetical protein
MPYQRRKSVRSQPITSFSPPVVVSFHEFFANLRSGYRMISIAMVREVILTEAGNREVWGLAIKYVRAWLFSISAERASLSLVPSASATGPLHRSPAAWWDL